MGEFTVLQDLEEAVGLQGLIDTVAASKPLTGAQQREEISQAFTKKDMAKLQRLQETLGMLVIGILENQIDPEEMELLDEDSLVALMRERLDQQELGALLKLRYELIRTRLFNHFTTDAKLKGLPEPEWEPGEVEVPSLGRKFVRQGGRAKNTIDLDALREAMGKDWDTVVKGRLVAAVNIPEHIEYTLDEDKLLAAVNQNPKLMEIVRDCVVPGGRTVQSFHVRKST